MTYAGIDVSKAISFIAYSFVKTGKTKTFKNTIVEGTISSFKHC